MSNFFSALLFVFFVALAGAWQVFVWTECRHVGHSALYCVMKSD